MKILIIPALLLALGLGGCETIRAISDVGTISVKNPIGVNESYEIEAAYATGLTLSRAYFRLRQCRASEQATFANPCSRRSIKVAIQTTDRRVRAILIPFRKYVRENDMISAQSLIGPLRAVIADFRATIETNGVQ